MAKVYLETSFVSACVSTRSDAASVYRRDTSLEWWRTQRQLHEINVSDEVVAELAYPAYPNREPALAFIADLTVLPISQSAVGLAEVLIRERAMPGPLKGDALHVAIATVAALDYILSWNVRHLANPNKIQHLRAICLKAGLLPPQIITPDLLWEV